MILRVDTASLEGFSRKLKELHRSAFPVAVRQTLTDAAFHVKKQSMPAIASKTFTERQKNFFKANSTAVPAAGFDIKKMVSEAGFMEDRLKDKSTNYAVKDLQKQDDGGKIGGKTFIPTDEARVGKSNNRMVKASYRMNVISNGGFLRAKRQSTMTTGKAKGTKILVSKKQAFIRAAIKAKEMGGNNAYVLGNANANGSRTLSVINKVVITKNGTVSKIKIHRTAIYTVKKGRTVQVKATNFMKRAGYESHLYMETAFIQRAQAQFQKWNQL